MNDVRVYLQRRGISISLIAHWYDDHGVRRQARMGTVKGEAAARKRKREIEAAGVTGTFVAPDRMTVDQWLDRYLVIVEKVDMRRATTVHDYTSKFATWVRPAVGSVRLQQVTPLDGDAIVEKMLAAGRSVATVRSVHRVARRAFKVAVMKGLIPTNPFDRVSVPTGKTESRHRTQAWRADELERYFAAIVGHRFETLFVLASATGMRRSELCGLRWDDVNLDGGHLVVRRAHTQIGRRIVADDPKSRAGGRVVKLDKATIAHLRRHRADQAASRLVHGDAWNRDGLVFCDGAGEPVLPATVSQAHERLVTRLDLPPIPLHGLRHTHASLLFRAGARPAMVSQRLGHSKASFTLDVYVAADVDDQDEATVLMAQLVPRPVTKSVTKRR